jgi:predicted lipoprotein with Yx(FWY)xxD motif
MTHLTTRARSVGLGATLSAVALFAAACGGSSSGGGNQSVGTNSGATTAAMVTTHSGPDGAYLTDAKGRTVYMFGKDKSTTSTCTGDCAKEWPPVTTSGTPTTGGSATGSMVGSSDRTDGTTQVTYAGHPLYYYADDESTGDMKGQGATDFGGTWTALTPSGSALTAAQPKPSSSDSGSSSEWG